MGQHQRSREEGHAGEDVNDEVADTGARARSVFRVQIRKTDVKARSFQKMKRVIRSPAKTAPSAEPA